jgi:hypothetical protein
VKIFGPDPGGVFSINGEVRKKDNLPRIYTDGADKDREMGFFIA